MIGIGTTEEAFTFTQGLRQADLDYFRQVIWTLASRARTCIAGDVSVAFERLEPAFVPHSSKALSGRLWYRLGPGWAGAVHATMRRGQTAKVMQR